MIRVLINKFTFMKDSKQSFKDLVKKMDSLEETQQGKLKGGFSTAVSRNCEFCSKFTFTFRKNFYL